MEQFRTPSIEMGGDSTLEGVEDNLLKTPRSTQLHSNIETLSAKKESIDRPSAGSQDRDRNSDGCQEDAASQVGGSRKSEPDIADR
jgi:hypothetical protein